MQNLTHKQCIASHLSFIKEMNLNNKNKSSKELTLEEIIQKSKFRKNIDHICLLQTKINKEAPKSSSLVNTPLQALSKPSKEFSKFGYFEQKKSIQSNHESQRKAINFITARTTKSVKQPFLDAPFNQQVADNKFKTITGNDFQTKEFKKSKENYGNSLERTNSLKSKTKKSNSLLCVKGASGNVITKSMKPFTAERTTRDLIPEYEMKKYQTLVELGSQLRQKQKTIQIRHDSQDIQNKKYHSFMMTKYSNAANIRHSSVKSKSYSQSKLKSNIPASQEFLKKKIEYRGIKTEQKINNNKVQNGQEFIQQKSKKMKKYQLILNINFEDQLRKETNNKTKNEIQSRIEQKPFLDINGKDFLEQILELQLLTEKPLLEDSPNKTQSKGFKGKKAISSVQVKSRYFIPEFIKPSLDLLLFEKKPNQKMITEEKQSVIRKHEEKPEQSLNRTFQQLAECVTGKRIKINKNLETNQIDESANVQKEVQLQIMSENLIDQQPNRDLEINNVNEAIHQSKKRKSKSKGQTKFKKVEQGDICAWNESSNKNSRLFKDEQQLFGF